jgi:uncharacterized membrane protein
MIRKTRNSELPDFLWVLLGIIPVVGVPLIFFRNEAARFKWIGIIWLIIHSLLTYMLILVVSILFNYYKMQTYAAQHQQIISQQTQRASDSALLAKKEAASQLPISPEIKHCLQQRDILNRQKDKLKQLNLTLTKQHETITDLKKIHQGYAKRHISIQDKELLKAYSQARRKLNAAYIPYNRTWQESLKLRQTLFPLQQEFATQCLGKLRQFETDKMNLANQFD